MQVGRVRNGEVGFEFLHKGNKLGVNVYDGIQYPYKKHMAPPVKVDTSKSVLSPMPGGIVEVLVEPGQAVVDGQALLIVEAMKM